MISTDSDRIERLCWWWLLSTPLLLAVTYPLWMPVRSTPYLPLLPISTPVTDALGWMAIAFGVRRALTVVSESAVAYCAVGLALLMIGDQLRWQPWAYHVAAGGIGRRDAAVSPRDHAAAMARSKRVSLRGVVEVSITRSQRRWGSSYWNWRRLRFRNVFAFQWRSSGRRWKC